MRSSIGVPGDINQELRAIRQAVERVGLSLDFVRGLFHENGMRLLREKHGV